MNEQIPIEAVLRLKNELSAVIKQTQADVKASTEAMQNHANTLGSQFTKVANDIGTSWKSALVGMGAAYLGFQGAVKIKSFMEESYQKAKQLQLAEVQLTAALGYYSIGLDRQAEVMSRHNLMSKVEFTTAQERLGNYVKEEDQIQRLIPAILNLSKAKGIDLAEASNIVGRAIETGSKQIGRYGIQIHGAAGSMEIIQSVIDQLDKKFKGQSEAVAKTATMWDALGYAINKVKTGIGSYFTANTAEQQYKAAKDYLATHAKVSAEDLKGLTAIITSFEKAQGPARFASAMDANFEVARRTMEETEKLRKAALMTSEAGKITLLKEEMATEIRLHEGHEEQIKLIKLRYTNEIKLLTTKVEKKKDLGYGILPEGMDAREKALKEEFEGKTYGANLPEGEDEQEKKLRKEFEKRVQLEDQAANQILAIESKYNAPEKIKDVETKKISQVKNALNLKVIDEQNAAILIKQIRDKSFKEQAQQLSQYVDQYGNMAEMVIKAAQNIEQVQINNIETQKAADTEAVEHSNLSQKAKQKKIDEINKEAIAKEKEIKRQQQLMSEISAEISGAEAVVKGYAQFGPVVGSVFAVLTELVTQTEVAAIASQHFALGLLAGPVQRRVGNGGTDSEPAMLTPGERVLTENQYNTLTTNNGATHHYHMGNIVINGNTNSSTIGQIRASQMDQIRALKQTTRAAQRLRQVA